MKPVISALVSVGAWVASTAAVLAGETPPPVVQSDNGDAAVALFLILGALVVVGGIMKPKAPPKSDTPG